jgi:4-hydroxyphenylacetate 3-monooxygenase/anthranilate 3-monooxygenase (FAD)/4-hydroxyphenylacetate 3-monooxygenase
MTMAIRTGPQFVAGLRDNRQVWLGGERVADVTKHPVLAGPIASLAALYDLQHDPQHTDLLTQVDEALGERVPRALISPASRQDLVQRRLASKAGADATLGLMGRSPDFLNVAVAAFASAAEYFGQVNPAFPENIRAYHEHCRRGDLFLAHATINPQTDRSKSSAEQRDETAHMRIVGKTNEGLVISGAKMIGTLVPAADELVVFPLPRYMPGDEPYTAAFAIPVATEGLRIVCREPFGSIAGRDPFDHPLARFDEMDATVIFEDVVVPWHRVFFHGDVDLANSLYDATTARHHTGHQGITRGVSKMELLVGIAISLAESSGTNGFLHVQEMLGEAIGFLELARGGVLLAEERGSLSRWGTYTPDIAPIQALRYHFPRMCARIVEVIQICGGGSMLATPTLADLDAADQPCVERFFSSAGMSSGRDRIQLLKLAWDASGDSFGQRQMLYERYHSGDPVRLAAQQYQAYPAAPLREAVARALDRTGDPQG